MGTSFAIGTCYLARYSFIEYRTDFVRSNIRETTFFSFVSPVVESYSKIVESVKNRIAKAQEAYTRQVKKCRGEVHYKAGNWVYLRIMKQRLKQVGKRCPKLSFRSFGPFPITKQINEVSVQLRLPP